MFRPLIMLTLYVTLASPAVTFAEAPVFPELLIELEGPTGQNRLQCAQPCMIDRSEVVGRTQARSEFTMETGKRGRPAQLQSVGGKSPPASGAGGGSEFSVRVTEKEHHGRLRLRPSRDLEAGFTVEIEDDRAHIIFLDVVETEDGPSTRRRHAEFRIEQLPIAFSIHDHRVKVSAPEPG